jgi:hypothetical protein
MTTLTPLIRWTITLTCFALGLSAILLAWGAATGSAFNWVLFGFEVIILMSAAFGIWVGWRTAPADVPLALACLAGSIFVATVLGYLGTNPKTVGPFSLRTFGFGRVVLIGVLGVVSVVVSLGADRQRWGRLVRGILLSLPLLALTVVFASGRIRTPLIDWIGGLPGPAIALVGVVAFILVTILLSSSVHLTIGAFAGAGDRSTT